DQPAAVLRQQAPSLARRARRVAHPLRSRSLAARRPRRRQGVLLAYPLTVARNASGLAPNISGCRSSTVVNATTANAERPQPNSPSRSWLRPWAIATNGTFEVTAA